jgi:hypothetical protein
MSFTSEYFSLPPGAAARVETECSAIHAQPVGWGVVAGDPILMALKTLGITYETV